MAQSIERFTPVPFIYQYRAVLLIPCIMWRYWAVSFTFIDCRADFLCCESKFFIGRIKSRRKISIPSSFLLVCAMNFRHVVELVTCSTCQSNHEDGQTMENCANLKSYQPFHIPFDRYLETKWYYWIVSTTLLCHQGRKFLRYATVISREVATVVGWWNAYWRA